MHFLPDARVPALVKRTKAGFTEEGFYNSAAVVAVRQGIGGRHIGSALLGSGSMIVVLTLRVRQAPHAEREDYDPQRLMACQTPKAAPLETPRVYSEASGLRSSA